MLRVAGAMRPRCSEHTCSAAVQPFLQTTRGSYASVDHAAYAWRFGRLAPARSEVGRGSWGHLEASEDHEAWELLGSTAKTAKATKFEGFGSGLCIGNCLWNRCGCSVHLGHGMLRAGDFGAKMCSGPKVPMPSSPNVSVF